MMKIDLADRIALVTGGGSGIGRAAALAFAEAGARVAVADLDAGAAEASAALVKSAGGEAIAIAADVTREQDVAAMVARTADSLGGLDHAVNSAGTTSAIRTATHEFEETEWRRVLDVNLTGVWLCMKHEIARMLASGGGAVVNLSSIYGVVSASGTAAYTASKHGVAGLTRAAALDYATQGIRVNAISPGYIRTPMVESVLAQKPGLEDWMVERTPLGRIGSPEEIGRVAVWLCSDAASFVNGLVMPVDGGLTAQ